MSAMLVVSLLLFVGLPGSLLSQNESASLDVYNPSGHYYKGPLRYEIPLLHAWPTLTSDMPPDVRAGYVLADSIARVVSSREISDRLATATSNDTLLYAAKYLYIMDDYDPILFKQWVGINLERTYKSPQVPSIFEIVSTYSSFTNDDRLYGLLLLSDYIIHVKILNIDKSYDSSAAWTQHANLVTAEIIDPIKGGFIIPCPFETPSRGAAPPYKKTAATVGACFQFEYRDEWPLDRDVEGMLPGKNMENWAAVGAEYIVFLRFAPVTGPSIEMTGGYVNNYTLYITGLGFTSTGCMYPIKDGIVADDQDDFGFGRNLTAAAWKVALRSKITELVTVR